MFYSRSLSLALLLGAAICLAAQPAQAVTVRGTGAGALIGGDLTAISRGVSLTVSAHGNLVPAAGDLAAPGRDRAQPGQLVLAGTLRLSRGSRKAEHSGRQALPL